MKTPAALLAAVAMLSACATSLTPDPALRPAAVANRAAPFPYPGVYTGGFKGGGLTYMLQANGKGAACDRSISGRIILGDIVYDGVRLYTEDATIDVIGVTEDQLQLRLPGDYIVALSKVPTAPTTCQEFFAKAAGR